MADPIKSAPDPAPSVAIAQAGAIASTRQVKGIPPLRPRWGFFKGLLTGAVIEVPAIALGVWMLAWLGAGDPDLSFMRIVRLTAIFAGIAAIFTAAGVGRLAAHASVAGGRKRAAWVGARAHAAATVGLLVIAAIPHGHIPERSWLWLAYPAVGLGIGAVCGALIGVICGGATPLGFSEVFALAKRPTDALKNLLAPEDLVKLGVALRDRTSSMFEGMFEPAPLPPEAPAPTKTIEAPVEAPPEVKAPEAKAPEVKAAEAAVPPRESNPE